MSGRVEQIGDATLYLGDAREILPTLGVVDAVVTDPPYGTQDLAGGYGRRQNWDKGNGLGRTIENDTDLSALAAVVPELVRVTPCGWLLVFYAARRTPEFVRTMQALNWFGAVIWDKAQPGLGYHIRYAHEDIAVFRSGEPPRPPQPLLSMIRACPTPELHPHQKPMLVLQALVGWAVPHGGIALDPFMGSGTTGVACLSLGRRFIGIEIDPVHFDIACRRIEAETRKPRLPGIDTPKPKQESIFEARYLPHGEQPAENETVSDLAGHHGAHARLAVRAA